MKRYLSAALAALPLMLATVPAQAASLTVTNVSGAWTNWKGGVNVDNTMDGDVAEIRWGNPSIKKMGRSGYDFGPGVAGTAYEEGETFTLGTFTHHNFPIDVGITSATLDVTFSFFLDADPSAIYTRTSQFIFNHFETANVPKDGVCVNGKQSIVDGVQVGCEDRVTAYTNPASSETFSITEDGVTRNYMFDVTGFDIGDGFWTVENADNMANLQARFTYEENVEPAPVPLPAAGWMLLAGLGGMGVYARRRRNN